MLPPETLVLVVLSFARLGFSATLPGNGTTNSTLSWSKSSSPSLQVSTSSVSASISSSTNTRKSSSKTTGIGGYIAHGLGGSSSASNISSTGLIEHTSSTSFSYSFTSTQNGSTSSASGTGRKPSFPHKPTTVTGTGTGYSNATVTSAPKYHNTSITAPPGFGVYDNTTFRTDCPFRSNYSTTDCYVTCQNLAVSCSMSWYTWSTSNMDYQESMQSKFGSSQVGYTTETFTYSAEAYPKYYYTVEAVTEFITITGTTSVQTYMEDISSCMSWSTVYSNPTDPAVASLNRWGTNTCIGSRSTPSTYSYIVTATTSIVRDIASYVLSSSITLTEPASKATEVYSDESSYSFSLPTPTCQVTYCAQPSDCKQCTIQGGTVQLFYWPVARSTALANGTTSSPTPTSMPAALEIQVVGGVTITSPSVAISFNTAYALNDCSKPVGSNHTGSVIVMPPGDVSSLLVGGDLGALGQPGSTYTFGTSTHVGLFFEATQFNYADLNWPYPMSAWIQQPQCFVDEEACQFIISGSLNPILAVPNQIRTLDPAWATCEVDWEGLYDPPTALTPRSTIVQATVPNAPQTTPAEPSPTPASPQPHNTSPASIPQPTSPNNPPADPTTKQSANPGPSPTRSTDGVNPADPTTQKHNGGGSGGSNDPSADPTSPIATIGSGASAVTVVPGSTPGEVIANSGGGETTLNAGDTGTINHHHVSIDRTGNVVVGVSSTANVPHPADPTNPVTVIGSNTVQANPSGSGVVINSGTTLSPGQATTITDGNGSPATVSVNGHNSVVIKSGAGSGTTMAAAAGQTPNVVAGQTFSAASNGKGIVFDGSKTLSAGGPAATVSHVVFSVNSKGELVVASSSTAQRNPTQGGFGVLNSAVQSAAQLSGQGLSSGLVVTGENGKIYTAVDPVGSVVVGGETLSIGQTATVDGLGTVVAQSSGLVVNGKTQAYSALPATVQATEATFNVGGHAYTALEGTGGSSTAVVDGTTLSVGGAPITISGETVSLARSGIVLASAGHTTTVAFHITEITVVPKTEVEAKITVGSETLTAFQVAGSPGVIEIDGKTLSLGGPAFTTGGVTISLASGGVVEHSSGEPGSTTIAFSTVTLTEPGLPDGIGRWSTATATSAITPNVVSAAASPTNGAAAPTTMGGVADSRQQYLRESMLLVAVVVGLLVLM